MHLFEGLWALVVRQALFFAFLPQGGIDEVEKRLLIYFQVSD